MKIVLNILLALASLGLVYLLIESIRKPINFKDTREFREERVRERLKQTAELQKLYKSLRNQYADDFDSLKYVLTNDTFLVDQVVGDKYDSTQSVQTIQVQIPAKDSLVGLIANSPVPEKSIEEYFEYLKTVPYSDGKLFYIKTDSAIVEGTDSMMTPTFEVGTTIGSYLPEFDSAGHVIYDPLYNPNLIRKVGDLYKPSTNGNW